MFMNEALRGNPVARLEQARTENGMSAFASTANACVDLFGSIGAMRGKNVIPAFEKAFYENPELAVRIAQWTRDIRGGSGERKLYRDILLWLEGNEPRALIESTLLANTAEIGRWDDLLIFSRDDVKRVAYQLIANALNAGNALCAKWMPRKGLIAVELRKAFGLSPKQYRKMLVNLTNVVETQMCSQNWNEINFSHVPSVAMSKYMTAFHRNATDSFENYKARLKDGTAKVNASAVYPYDVVKMISYYGDNTVADEMWKALPNYMNGQAILPMVDVSGSMSCSAGGSSVTCLDVAVSIGLYCSEKSYNSSFRDSFLTFTDSPQFVRLTGDLSDRVTQLRSAEWAMNTNLSAAFDAILNVAVHGNVPESEMPRILLILSDMQFDQCTCFDDNALGMARRKYANAGYELPKIVFWNLNDRGNKSVRFNEQGVALVSGFSPAIMKAILSANLNKFSPESIMLEAVMIDRYKI